MMSENIDLYKEEAKQDMDAGAGAISGTAEAETKPARKGNNAWIPGVVLIGIGVIFLLNQFTGFELDNWWALFILIPAFGAFANALRTRRATGRLGHDGRGSLIGGLILTFVAAIFLFELDWGAVWPVFLIIGGLGLLLGNLWD